MIGIIMACTTPVVITPMIVQIILISSIFYKCKVKINAVNKLTLKLTINNTSELTICLNYQFFLLIEFSYLFKDCTLNNKVYSWGHEYCN